MRSTRFAETNLSGVTAVRWLPDTTVGQLSHAETVAAELLGPLHADSRFDALRTSLTDRDWPADARIVPQLKPQIGVTHELTPRREIADTAYTSNNWAGSTISGTWAHAVGIWRVPTVTKPTAPAGTDGGWDSSSWVGIDGSYGSNDVLQAGVEQSVGADGSTSYVAWYEWYAPKAANSPQYIYQTNIDNMPIEAGDEVFAGIHYRDGQGYIMFGNVDRGRYFTIQLAPPPGATFSGNSVEWIVEAPNTGEPSTSLPKFTPVVFSAAMGSDAAGTTGADPNKGDTTNIVASNQTFTSVTLGTDSVTVNYVDPSGWHDFQLDPPGQVAASGGIAAVSRVSNSMELWWVGADGSIQDNYWYDGASWQRFALAPAGSASTTSPIAAVSRIPNSIELWWVGADGSIQDNYWYDGASWQRFTLAPAGSAATGGGIAAVSRVSNSMEVWWVGADGSIQDNYWYDGASWQRFTLAPAGSASTTSPITAVSRIPNSMELWWIGPHGSVEGAFWYDGGQWARYQLAPDGSASPTGGLKALSRIPNSMELWWIGPRGSVEGAFWYDGGQWARYQLAPEASASLNGGIAAVSRIPNSMELWWVGADGSIQDNYWYDGGSWQRFMLTPAGSAAASGRVAALSRIPNSMEIWWVGAGGSIQDNYWYQ